MTEAEEGKIRVWTVPTCVLCSCLLEILTVLEMLYSWASQLRSLLQVYLKAEKMGDKKETIEWEYKHDLRFSAFQVFREKADVCN